MKWMIIVFLIASCYQKMDAEGRLKEYFNLRFKGDYEREEIGDFLSGEMKEDVLKMNAEDFQRFRSLKIKKIKNLRILNTNCKEEICFLTYTFRYSKKVFDGDQSNNKDVEVEIKKVAKLELLNEQWKITAIDNTKSFVKFHKAIDISQ